MLIDVDELKDKVKPQIKNTRKYLESAKNSSNSISVPNDFSCKDKLIKIPQNILEIDNRVNIIEKWLEETIDNFDKVEKDNKELIGNIMGIMSETTIGKKVKEVKEDVSSTIASVKPDEIMDNVRDKVKSTIDYLNSDEWKEYLEKRIKENEAKAKEKEKLEELKEENEEIENENQGLFSFSWEDICQSLVTRSLNLLEDVSDTVDMAKQTASEIGEEVEIAISWAWETGGEIKDNVVSYVSDKIDTGIEFTATKISNAYKFVYGKMSTPPWSYITTTGTSIVNGTIGLVKGVQQLAESLIDVGVMAITGVGSIGTGAIDGVSYLYKLAKGEKEDWSSVTGKMWKGVMGYVAENHVENKYKWFYSNTLIGKILDENAVGALKSDGIITNIASGIGYIAGIAGLTIATLRNRHCSNWCSNRSKCCNNCSNRSKRSRNWSSKYNSFINYFWNSRCRKSNTRNLGRNERLFMGRPRRNV